MAAATGAAFAYAMLLNRLAVITGVADVTDRGRIRFRRANEPCSYLGRFLPGGSYKPRTRREDWRRRSTQMSMRKFHVWARSLNRPWPKPREKTGFKCLLKAGRSVGQDRLPSFDDLSKLPFTTAFVKEVLRWRPIVTAGVPRLAEQEDEYMGYRVPKGAVLIANHWSIDHDDDVFGNTESFRPQRWLHDTNLPPSSGFGVGRRVCAGKHFTMNSLNIVIARLLWAYDIKPEKNGNGIELMDPFKMKQIGLVSRPMPFRACFQVRSPSRELVIRNIGARSQEVTDEILNLIHASVAGTKAV